MDLEVKLDVLSQLAKIFNEKKILWALGASGLLYCKGIVPVFHDLDIMIGEADVDAVDGILSRLGTKMNPLNNPKYNSKAFFQYSVDGVEVDVIAGFVIVDQGEEHYHPLESAQITDQVVVNGQVIYLQDLSCWHHYYALMGRKQRVALIDHHL